MILKIKMAKVLPLSFMLISLALLQNCQLGDDQVVDVTPLMGKTPKEVAGAIGEPDTTYYTYVLNKKIFTQQYFQESYQVEFFYPKGFLEEVLVNNPMPLPFNQQSLEQFGVIVDKQPKEHVENVLLTWEETGSLSRVSIYSIHRDSTGIPDDYRFYFKKKIQQPGVQ